MGPNSDPDPGQVVIHGGVLGKEEGQLAISQRAQQAGRTGRALQLKPCSPRRR